MFDRYLYIVVYGLLAAATAVAILLLSRFVGPRRFRTEKLTPYECGVPLLGSAREPFAVKFYLVAILFVLFDIETVFLIPWGVIYKSLGVAGLIEMGIFISVLSAGLFYVWKKGVLDWA